MPDAKTCVLAFGMTNAQSGDASKVQDIWRYSSKENDFFQIADPQADPQLFSAVNNRYGISSITHNGKQVLIDMYVSNGTNLENAFIVMYNGETTKVLPTYSFPSYYYQHLDGNGSNESAKPVVRFFTDKRGFLCSAVYTQGIMKYSSITYDEDGFPNLDDRTAARATFLSPSGGSGNRYWKGAVYDPIADRVYGSYGRDLASQEMDPSASSRYSIKSKGVFMMNMEDADRSVNIVFTEYYIVKSVINTDGSLYGVASLSNAYDISTGTYTSMPSLPLIISNSDQSKLFKLEPGKSVKYMLYTDTGNPAEESSWKEYRPELLPNKGSIGGAGAIIEDPFVLVWYQNDSMMAWGSIPEPGSDASVTQTITDSFDPVQSVQSIVKKTVPL